VFLSVNGSDSRCDKGDLKMAVGSQSAAGVAGEAAGPVDHAVLLLKLLAESGEPLGVNELSRRLGVHKSTASRLLRTLERHHLVRRDADHGRISLGPGVVALAGPMLGEMDAIAVGRPIVQALAEETGETVSLGIWNGREAVIAEQVLGTRNVVSYTRGRAVAAHSTAVGKTFLAFLPDAAVRPVLDGPLPRFTEFTIVERTALEAEIKQIRQLGYAINYEENELEACGIAAAVFDFRGEVAIVLNVAIPSFRFKEQKESLAKIVVDHARKLSSQLGYARPRKRQRSSAAMS
jgi:DNA-binding IclR family transcriptional regulator